MKRILVLSACLWVYSFVSAQHVYHLPSVQPDNEHFENAYVLPLDSDSLTSSFIIWAKNEIAAHYHRYHTEQVLVIEGAGIMQFGDKRINIVAGDFITIPPNTVHGVQVTSASPLKVLSLQSPRYEGNDRVLIRRE